MSISVLLLFHWSVTSSFFCFPSLCYLSNCILLFRPSLSLVNQSSFLLYFSPLSGTPLYYLFKLCQSVNTHYKSLWQFEVHIMIARTVARHVFANLVDKTYARCCTVLLLSRYHTYTYTVLRSSCWLLSKFHSPFQPRCHSLPCNFFPTHNFLH